MFKKTFILFAVLAFTPFCFSAELDVPKVNIRGAEKAVPSDDFVELSAELPKVKPDGWVGVTYEWKVFFGYRERKFLKQGEDGSVIAIVPPKGKNLLIVLVASHLYLTKDGDGKSLASVRTSSAFVILEIEGGVEPGPNPPPGPGPMPPPPKDDPDPPAPVPPKDEPLPVGTFGLAQVALNSLTTVKDPQARKAGAAVLSSSFSLVSKIITDKKLFDVKAILLDTKERNDKALVDAGLNPEDWKEFGKVLGKEMEKLNVSGKLVIASQISAAFAEVALGLERGAK